LASISGSSSSLKIGLEPTEPSLRVPSCNQSRTDTRCSFSSNGIAPTPYIYKNLGYDIFTDLTPIATIVILDGLFMLVDAKSPYETVQQFIDHAKKDHAVYGSPGVGNGLHLAAEIFSKKADIKMP
jgi:tripartite-type tricarboxylate transporter receptor subunit TctC